MDTLLDTLASSVTQADSLDKLTRPLLEMLETVTGLESTYLTSIDLPRNVQHILYSRNSSRDMTIPEGLAVPWGDTLCKRALDEGRPFTNDVASAWGDSEAARALGIQTYLSTPVRIGGAQGELYGTLCAASPARHELDPHAARVLALFATLIGQYVERERLMSQLMRANEALAQAALTDTLTGLPNRRALHDGLERLLALGTRRECAILLAFIDLDHFKAINDEHGHDAGDRFLVEVARRLRGTLRAGDMGARLGGDEFVVAGAGPDQAADVPEAERAFCQRVERALIGDYALGQGLTLHYAGASVGVLAIHPGTLDAAQALREADGRMYEVKQQRKTGEKVGQAGT